MLKRYSYVYMYIYVLLYTGLDRASLASGRLLGVSRAISFRHAKISILGNFRIVACTI
jgi:hypothetical protein